jgi:LmbE family N-acetylglucosaminyl deacetylase
MALNAHGDDESMFMGQTLNDLVREGVYVVGVTASDGEQHGDPDIRRGEVNAAYGALGIPVPQREFFGAPDSMLHTRENVLRMASGIGEAAVRHKINTFITPGWEGVDGHSDHVAIHIASVIAAVELSCDYQMPAVLALRGESEGKYAVPVDPRHKIDLLQFYPSQFGDRAADVAEQAYPFFLEAETYDRMDTLQEIGSALLSLGTQVRRIPHFELESVN